MNQSVVEQLIKNGINNLKEFEYENVNENNILTDMMYSSFFLSMLRDNLGQGFDEEINYLISKAEESSFHKKDIGEKFIDVLPIEARGYEIVQAYKKCIVVESYSDFEKQWVGPHKNVHHWWVLDNGYAVGFNENPSRGWSFPKVKYKK